MREIDIGDCLPIDVVWAINFGNFLLLEIVRAIDLGYCQ